MHVYGNSLLVLLPRPKVLKRIDTLLCSLSGLWNIEHPHEAMVSLLHLLSHRVPVFKARSRSRGRKPGCKDGIGVTKNY